MVKNQFKTILLIVGLLIFFGCSSMRQSGWYEHKSQYASWEHMKFSLSGYEKPRAEDLKMTQKEKWWGVPAEYRKQIKGKR